MVLVHEIHQVFARKLIEDFARELLLGDSERGNVCDACGEFVQRALLVRGSRQVVGSG